MAAQIPLMDPIDRSVLVMPRYAHRADLVWNDATSMDDKLRCNVYCSMVYKDGPRHPGVVALLKAFGFYGVDCIGRLQLDWSLITALVERWRPETHAFHLPFGEVGITLQDVEVLLGLPIDGEPLSGPRTNSKALWMQMWTDFAGFTPNNDLNTSVIRMNALQRWPVHQHSTNEELITYTRVFIWQLLGGLLFPSTTGNKIKLYFLELLQGPLGEARRWSWGSAVLGFLYYNMCKAAKANRRNIGGCLLLLQIWAWERLPMVRPRNVLPYENLQDMPYGCRWACRHNWEQSSRYTLRIYRDQLDGIRENKFVWRPYALQALPRFCVAGVDLWTSNVMLIYCDISEMYYPGRFCRQFGAMQHIPPATESQASHHASGAKNSGWPLTLWAVRHNRRIAFEFVDHPTYTPAYREWYASVGKRRICNPLHGRPTTGYVTTNRETSTLMQCMGYIYRRMTAPFDVEDIREQIARCLT
ncbi:unnamed protein product [Cuscuta europaea]|uniref:Aminotransferase-like plant mobile domain-containing protein n=1 Tax=Cuscuta europaea TaxID=41803 RepID=A0A9P0ZWV4_CUSEU|nr:unnamed protein product [Cuscuta europaea]